MTDPMIDRDDLRALLKARGELGEDLEPHVLDAFLDRIARGIDARVDARMAQQAGRHAARPGGAASVILGLGSIGMGIGATGAATGMGRAAGVVVAIVAWIAIAVVNLAQALRR